MSKQQQLAINKARSDGKIAINYTLLAICFTIFALIISISPKLFLENEILTLQLTLAIPLFISSLFARDKLAYTENSARLNSYGFFTFIIAYSFLINTVGLLLSSALSVTVSSVFFLINILLALAYSYVTYGKGMTKRICKDGIFILLIIILGLLPSLGIY
ncbi:MAG TPA: hypothetical protein VI968_00970 [archaeon]|nr:hypothetical protein [archaeon]